MSEIKVNGFYGLQEDSKEIIKECLNVATIEERLAVILFFMKDCISKDCFSISNIAKEFLKIYPQGDMTLNAYESRYIRTVTSLETSKVNDGDMLLEDRLFININNEGKWKCTHKGEKLAKDFLRRNGIKVYKLQN